MSRLERKPTRAQTSAAQLKGHTHLWGATDVPFTEGSTHQEDIPQIRQAEKRLEQSAALRSLMLLSGPNGVGKSQLVSYWKNRLDPRLYQPLAVTQSSLSHAGLLAYLTRKLGKPSGNRSTNLLHLEEALAELGDITAVILLDEAQNYSHAALEEVRLLLGIGMNLRPAMSLILIGDDYFLGALKLRSHRALYTRIACHQALTPWSGEEIAQLLESAQKAVGLSETILAPAAEELIVSASGGLPRSALHVARAAWIAASEEKASQISAEHVQSVLPSIPSAGEQRA